LVCCLVITNVSISEPLLSFVVNFGSSHRFRRIKVYPKGNGDGKGNSLSVFLELVDGGKLPPKKTVWAEYKLRVLDQRHDNHVEKTSKPPHKTSFFINKHVLPTLRIPIQERAERMMHIGFFVRST